MGKCRIVYRVGSEVVVIHPAPKSAHTYDELMARSMRGDLEGCEYEDVDKSEIPQTRKYRNAWRKEKGKPFTLDATVKAEVDAQRSREEQELISAEMRKLAEQSLIDKGTIVPRVIK